MRKPSDGVRHILRFCQLDRYKDEGSAFAPKIVRILAAGGSQSPTAILGKVGIDLADPAFWQTGMVMLQGMVEEVETIPIPKE